VRLPLALTAMPSARQRPRAQGLASNLSAGERCRGPALGRVVVDAPRPRNGLRMDSDCPVTRRYAMTRATVALAKRPARGPLSVARQYGGMVGDVGIEPTAAVGQASATVTGKTVSLMRYGTPRAGPECGGPPPLRAGGGPPFTPLSRSDGGRELSGSCPRICPRDVQTQASSRLRPPITTTPRVWRLCRYYVGLEPHGCEPDNGLSRNRTQEVSGSIPLRSSLRSRSVWTRVAAATRT
jgi:hypothetical protein